MIHLHIHSHYSLLCGASSPAELIARAADLGFSALALTDLNAMYGTVEFQKECEKAGLRAIHGVEITDEARRYRPGAADRRFPAAGPRSRRAAGA